MMAEIGCEGRLVVLADFARNLEAEIAELQHNLKNWGTIEIAIRNPAVAESMRHWECRAEKAEAALKALTEQEADEPTKEMLAAGAKLVYSGAWETDEAYLRDIYKAMRAAMRGEDEKCTGK